MQFEHEETYQERDLSLRSGDDGCTEDGDELSYGRIEMTVEMTASVNGSEVERRTS